MRLLAFTVNIFNILMDFFRPKSAIGLKLDSRILGAVRVSNGLNSIEIEDFKLSDINDPEDHIGGLKELLRDFSQQADVLISTLPMTQVMMRNIDLDFENLKKLDRIIKYQVEPYIPVPVE